MREISSNTYGPSAFYLAQNMIDMILNILFPLILELIVFWGIGFLPGFMNFLKLFLALFMINCAAQSYGYLMATSFGDVTTANAFSPLTSMLFI